MEDTLKYALVPLIGCLLLSSCSWYKGAERSLLQDEDKKSSRSRPVSREQYDNLLLKYEELTKKYELLKENKGQVSLVDEVQKNSADTISEKPSSFETVDPFEASLSGQQTAINPQSPIDIDDQLNMFRRGLALKSTNLNEATKIFQTLETQGTPAIRARSKFQMGEILYSKEQYDLALQVFEDIIQKHAHSGVVIEALKYAQNCSDKLSLQNKKEQYASMLNDVFEMQ